MNGEQPKKRRRIWPLILAALMVLAVSAWLWRARQPAGGPDALREIPLVLQSAYKETVAVIGGVDKSVYTSGCGAACLSMAVGYLTDDHAQTPETLFRWACDNNLYFGDGLGQEALTQIAEHWKLDGEWIKNDRDAILAALGKGLPVIAHMGPGTFTRGGHYILLIGVDEEGKIQVNDPGSAQRSGKRYDLDLIIREARNGNAFMILRRAGALG